MIKKITLILILSFVVISCGKKGDPKYKETNKDTQFKRSLIYKT